MTWYDLTPMRPDQFAKTNVFRWREAVACRGAYERGIQDATRENDAMTRLLAEDFQA